VNTVMNFQVTRKFSSICTAGSSLGRAQLCKVVKNT
jgi:hypothetical protein